MKKYVIYKHTNKSNGKVYIGITSMNPEKRWQNGFGYKNNRHFNGAIQKYGWDNFEHEILYENLEELQAKTLEISLIRFYDSTNPDNGYNISTGGEGSSGCKHSDESKKKISESKKGRKHSVEARIKLSESHKGYKASAETRKKMSENHRGGFPKQPIICIETCVEYDSYHDAKRKTGLPIECIRQSCLKGYACKGLHFKKL